MKRLGLGLLLCLGLTACGGGGGGGGVALPAASTNTGASAPAFSANMVSGKVLEQSVSPTVKKVYTFNSDKSLFLDTVDSGVTVRTTGTWDISGSGAVTAVLSNDTITFQLIQNTLDSIIATLSHTLGSISEPIVSLSYVVPAPPPADPPSIPFTTMLVGGKPLQQVFGTLSKTFIFNANDGTLSVISNNNGVLSGDAGSWVIGTDDRITADLASGDTLVMSLNSASTSALNVNITHTVGTAETSVVLNYLMPFTDSLVQTGFGTTTFYIGYYSGSGVAWRVMDFNDSSLFSFTDWNLNTTVDVASTTALIGAWMTSVDTGTLSIAAATATKNYNSSFTILGQDTVNEYLLVFSTKGAYGFPVLERWYYGTDKAAQVATFLSTGI